MTRCPRTRIPAVATFRAEVLLDFEAESIETAGRELRRLEVAAREVGFAFRTARVEPQPPEDSDSSGWTPYAPLDP
jgi:hypothetical protein